jgi:hypothetical protein
METPRLPADSPRLPVTLFDTFTAIVAQPQMGEAESTKSATTDAAGSNGKVRKTGSHSTEAPASIREPAGQPAEEPKYPVTAEFGKSASVQAVRYKIASDVQASGNKPLTVRLEKETSLTEEPQTVTTPESGKSTSIWPVKSKIGLSVQADKGEAPILRSNDNASPTETPTPPALTRDDVINANTLVSTALAEIVQPRVLAGEFPQTTSSQAASLKTATANPEPEAKTEISTVNASPMETPRPPADSPRLPVTLFDTFTAIAAQPQMGEAESTKSATTDAAGSNGKVRKTTGSHSTEASASTREPAGQPAEPAATSQEPVTQRNSAIPTMAFASAVPIDGTRGALSSQEMKFTTEKNEIAGPAAQKVPSVSPKDDLSARRTDNSAAEVGSGLSGHKPDSIGSALVMDLPSKSSELNIDAPKGTGAAQATDHSAAQAEHVGHLLDQHVVMMHQSGANKLAVSLKLDPNTELSLRLTNHNGQIEASMRLERGIMPGLENHWRDLQESLARQNVQLLPLENKASARTTVFSSPSSTTSASSFNQSSQNPQRRNRDTRQDLPLAGDVQTVSVTSKATTRTVSRQGWESWA